MNKAVTLFTLSALLLLFGMTASSEQKPSRNGSKPSEPNARVLINVKGNQVANGVVILGIVKQGSGFHLQCNHGLSSCTVLENGEYQLVELPRNFGLYDCKGVHVCPGQAAAQDADKLGEYCLIED